MKADLLLVAAAAAQAAVLAPRQGPSSCNGQSCEIATVAGSTGATSYDFPNYPTGDTQKGDCCIVRYFPGAKNRIYSARPGLQDYCAKNGGDAPLDSNPPGVGNISKRSAAEPLGVSTSFADYTGVATIYDSPHPALVAPEIEPLTTLHDLQKRATCKPKILIYAKGSLEPGDLGITVGPALQRRINSADKASWDIMPVKYDNSFDNNYCLGLPGGVTARQLLESVSAQCPDSLIVMSGYSQGAMVVRNALARANSKAVSQVKNVVTFGDPFDGAKIGQYSGAINVFCNKGDGVCTGQVQLSAAHLSYTGANTTAGANLILATQK